MKKYLLSSIILISFSLGGIAYANCKHVYTIGAYDEVFAKHASITKLGPLPASEIPPGLPKSFLEKDGSYAGGEAFCTIKQACRILKQQVSSGVLPNTENWHIYILDAGWNQDTYKLRLNNFRIKHPVKVLKLVKQNC